MDTKRNDYLSKSNINDTPLLGNIDFDHKKTEGQSPHALKVTERFSLLMPLPINIDSLEQEESTCQVSKG